MRRVAVISTKQYVFPLRIAKTFASAGTLVAAICPKANLLRRLGAVAKIYTMSSMSPAHDVSSAIQDWMPDIVVACDDDAAFWLHKAYDVATPEVRRIICSSQGDPKSFEIIASKSRLMEFATKTGVLCPETDSLNNVSAKMLSEKRYPFVLKLDYASAGNGVRVVHTPAEAKFTLAEFSKPKRTVLDVLKAAKRLSLWPLKHWAAQRDINLSGQELIDGEDANIAVFCSNGRIISWNAVKVSATAHQNGPGALISFVNNTQMLKSTEKLVASLKLSGFYGFDFIIGKNDRQAYLIEANPRATPILHLTSSFGVNLIESACEHFSGSPPSSISPPITEEFIAMFPAGLAYLAKATDLRQIYLDAPWDEPWLLKREAYLKGNKTLATMLSAVNSNKAKPDLNFSRRILIFLQSA